ncbi:MAG: flagellar assembly protein FliW [Synergistaceae bacterium]|nr:flagellar assembly protein FliW [Synergistaceae bacterium]MBQ4430320.1 flagellar assembly protein FliW [Synergistaceae bacterium]MBR0150175.1 flagellar assembly protein FliW [Synergistaceae bacterium]
MSDMKINTGRFGEVSYSQEEVLFFPRGIPAFETNHSWILVGNDDSAVKWLQSLDDGELALPVTSPDAIQPDYNARIPDDELTLIGGKSLTDLALLIVVSIPEAAPWNMTANLRAPIVINIKTRKAVQVIALNEEYPIRHVVFPEDVREKMKASAFQNGGDE